MSLHERIEQIHQLDDDALLRSLKRFVGSSNHLTALVLAHLAEVDARAAYRRWACDTLTTYCVYELRLSEDEAQRRCRAARIARQFPILFEMLADTSIHLTGILLLGPYLTEENHREVLARASYRRKVEIQRLVAELAPSCEVPAVIEPLGPARSVHVVARSSWGVMHEAVMGGVRRLVAGDGPAAAPSAPEAWRETLQQDIEGSEADAPALSSAPRAERCEPQVNGPSSAKPLTAPLRYKVQFTADQEYVELFEQARALAWHQLPSGDIATLQKLAMQALVEKLLRRKCAVKHAEPSEPTVAALNRPQPTEPKANASELARAAEPPPVAAAAPARSEPTKPSHPTNTHPSHSSSDRRRLPAAVRRGVWQRDGGRCTFTDARGQRCPATAAIEFHHEQPHARGGPDTIENIHLKCRLCRTRHNLHYAA